MHLKRLFAFLLLSSVAASGCGGDDTAATASEPQNDASSSIDGAKDAAADRTADIAKADTAEASTSDDGASSESDGHPDVVLNDVATPDAITMVDASSDGDGPAETTTPVDATSADGDDAQDSGASQGDADLDAIDAADTSPGADSSNDVVNVVGAVALSATTVRIDFDGPISPANLNADGSQFLFTGGLTSSGATVAGNQVTVTTSPQVADMSYTLTVAGSVTDTLGHGVSPSANTATLLGFHARAHLLINEVNPNLPSGTDLVELRATVGGDIANIKLEMGIGSPVTLITLPALNVATGDLIVIHLAPPAGVTAETTSKDQCLTTQCYIGAWDLLGGSTGIVFTNRVLGLIAADDTLEDAVPFVMAGTTTPIAFPPDLQAIQTAGLWLPVNCGGVPCTYTSTPLASDSTISVDWTSVDSSVAGTSIQRHVTTDNNVTSDWVIAPSSWGLSNP